MMFPSPADSSIIHGGECPRDDGSDEDRGYYESARVTDSPKRMTKMFWHSRDLDVVQELVPEQVRWFYKEDVKGKWVAFIGYDSLRIECRYRALGATAEDVDTRIHVRGGLYEADLVNKKCRPVYWKGDEQEILRGTWFEDGGLQPLSHDHAVRLENEHLAKFIGTRIPVRPRPISAETAAASAASATDATDGALTVSADSIKALATKRVLLRLQFEQFHVEWYGPCDIYRYSESTSSRVFRSVTHTLGMHKRGMGTRLVRGYTEEACMDDSMANVTHLVFVIHGIGQKINQNRIVTCADELRSNVQKLTHRYFPDMRDSSRRVEFLPVEWRSKLMLDGDLVESITPEKLKSFRTLLNSTAMDILYYTSPLYRSEIVATLEVELNRLYGLFCDQHPYFEANKGKVSIVAHSLGCVIMYDILTGWDPIMLYDQYVTNVLKDVSATSSDFFDCADFQSSHERSQRLHDFYLKSIHERQVTSLKFQVDNFFCLGSPLGVFLSLRGVRPQVNGLLDHILPKTLCTRLFNVYHATDPVAYRLEPLVLKHYSTVAPLRIHRLNSEHKTPYCQMEPRAYAALVNKSKPLSPRKATENTAAAASATAVIDVREDMMTVCVDSDQEDGGGGPSQQEGQPVSSSGSDYAGSLTLPNAVAMTTPSTSSSHVGFSGAVRHLLSRFGRGGKKDVAAMDEKFATELENCEDSSDDAGDETWESLESVIEHTDLEHRLDYVMPSSGALQNGYWGALFSHTSYWASQEVALFILTHVFPEYGPVK